MEKMWGEYLYRVLLVTIPPGSFFAVGADHLEAAAFPFVETTWRSRHTFVSCLIGVRQEFVLFGATHKQDNFFIEDLRYKTVTF
ncbi:hypothetical protein BIV60_02430 [Bacillus sp. MUM 116]|uniref:hypothetical protein n=1 Tax=Bacillus sp. MUM 116 TaxID=1678002 RepID=UPI0008F5A3B9|nr:hypothetical protein [Bacillus sp. MUM 116]OIK16885.1 hypothetical protein BIV60_02430 [Bacillus sp. MUM 116]